MQLLAAALQEALTAELAAERHGPIRLWAATGEAAAEVMATIGVAPGSPARAFLAEHPQGVLIIATAEVWQ